MFLIEVALLLIVFGCESNSISNILNKLEFNQAVGIYTINIKHSENNGSSLLLFGSTSNLKKDTFEKLNKSDITITLSNEKKDEIEFSPDDIEWELTDQNFLVEGFSIRLNSDRILGLEKLGFDKIKIKLGSKTFKKNISPVYLQFYSGEENGISVMESPISPKNVTALNKEYSYSYKILDSNHIITSDIKAELIYPKEVKSFIEIVTVEVNPDIYAEEEIKEEFRNKVDKKILKELKVYE
ncbi:hypothetical protein BSK63_23230, partial [Paenibacillus odorifer]